MKITRKEFGTGGTQARDYRDFIVSEEKGGRYFCFRSGLLVHEELLRNGSYYASGWNTAGYPAQIQTAPAVSREEPTAFAMPYAFSLTVEGETLTNGYEYVGETHGEKDGTYCSGITLRSVRKPLEVTVVTKADGTNVLVRSLRLKNLSEAPLSVEKIVLFGGGLFSGAAGYAPENQFSLGYMVNSTGCAEGDYHRMALPRGEFSFGRTLYSERHRQPFFTLENKATGQILLGQFGFSGGFTFRFRSDLVWGARKMTVYRIKLTEFEMRVLINILNEHRLKLKQGEKTIDKIDDLLLKVPDVYEKQK